MLRNLGARKLLFGVRIGDKKKIQKQIKKDERMLPRGPGFLAWRSSRTSPFRRHETGPGPPGQASSTPLRASVTHRAEQLLPDHSGEPARLEGSRIKDSKLVRRSLGILKKGIGVLRHIAAEKVEIPGFMH
jgi:hypothetical protein